MKDRILGFLNRLRYHPHSRHVMLLSFASLTLFSIAVNGDDHDRAWKQFAESTTAQNQQRKITKF